jgi:hypothetical protein
MPALETLQQASGGRLELIFGDMLKIDERDLLKNEPKADKWEDGDVPLPLLVAHAHAYAHLCDGHKHVMTHTAAMPWRQHTECPVRIVGNLPFAVATELLLKWLRQIPEREGPFAHGTPSPCLPGTLSQSWSPSRLTTHWLCAKLWIRSSEHDADVPARGWQGTCIAH